MWKTGWGQVSGEFGDWMGASVWRVGGLDGDKCLESGTNGRRSCDVWRLQQGCDVKKRMNVIEDKAVSRCQRRLATPADYQILVSPYQ